MPISPPSLCAEHGCGRLVQSGKCDEHRAQSKREAEARRPARHDAPYDARWRRESKAYLSRHPQCEGPKCMLLPWYARPNATEVDHNDGLGPNGPRGFDEDNWTAMCHSCHSSKTASQDGGFGNPKRQGAVQSP